MAHYLVHAYDYPPLADKGIRIAGQYARIAPAAPHARHMPSHIYSMVGMWEESIASNRSALEVQPDYHHATDFMVYAHLQLAQDAKAKALVDLIARLPQRRVPHPGELHGGRCRCRRATRSSAPTGPARPRCRSSRPDAPWPTPSTRFARGLGMARSGDLAGAKREVQALQELRRALEQVEPVLLGRSHRGADPRRRRLGGVRGGRARPGAEAHARAPPTARMAASSTWRWRTGSIRCASCSVSCCSRAGKPAAALGEFEASLKENPNRYRGLSGAARAAEAGRRSAEGRRVLREARRAVQQGRHHASGNGAREGFSRIALNRDAAELYGPTRSPSRLFLWLRP